MKNVLWLSRHAATLQQSETLKGVLPTKCRKHTLRVCSENQELLNTL